MQVTDGAKVITRFGDPSTGLYRSSDLLSAAIHDVMLVRYGEIYVDVILIIK